MFDVAIILPSAAWDNPTLADLIVEAMKNGAMPKQIDEETFSLTFGNQAAADAFTALLGA